MDEGMPSVAPSSIKRYTRQALKSQLGVSWCVHPEEEWGARGKAGVQARLGT